MLKISSARLLAEEIEVDPSKPVPDVIQNLAFGPVPGWLVLTLVAAFYVALTWLTFRESDASGELAHGEMHV